ncbi:NAD-dependent epimerase/dehydratase family protein [Bermanella marisrubri]|uniref:Putative dehydrogenase domain of multifunctional non-ribosomal peptide synthetases and related enzyme n=1 Tax=Bermanella marisrubri TaxID=207949 RepID=Q1N697_9GAMM|nr:fatty acyl-CoA reductase [Bermanella marisrubri]EAT13695.1 putative dehydrogenase domain of multifunctional non-ribosomal peptide synthetases and related enzyme [Oceanobacter sp. RED65] [Bermanella marisrubri]QIZ84473.1 NAD-dependent epimerase/dehydratase family protein [Bermanella marisrubri]
MSQYSAFSVSQSLKGKHIFLTGVTGFLGKAILEKLLYSVPQLAQIHILVRGGKVSAKKRFQHDILGSSIFERLKEQHGEHFEEWVQSKINLVEGELTQPMFDLPSAEFAGLANQLDLIINSAASVNFRENLEKALNINTLCLNNIIALAQYNVAAQTPVMQISTCYVNGFNKGQINEEVVGPASGLIPQLSQDCYDIDSVFKRVHSQIEQVKKRKTDIEQQEQALIKLGIKTSQHFGWNDTYTFTKWLGEQLLIQKLGKQSLTILRPSIIESAVREPAPGWVEGVKVADALIYAYAKGRVSIFPGRDEGILDVIPVDLVANAAALSAAQLMESNQQTGYRIYQCCSGSRNPIKLKEFIRHIQNVAQARYQEWPKLFADKPQEAFKTVSPKRFKLYMSGFTAITWAKTIIGRVFGSNAASQHMLKAKTTASLANIFGFYTAPNYRFSSQKLEQLVKQFDTTEQRLYDIRADHFDWKYYLQEVHMDGLHKYALADRQELKPKHVKKRKRETIRQAA